MYPKLDKHLLRACTYRVAASAAPTRVPSPVSGAQDQPEAHYALLEKRLGDLGRERQTSEAYERIVKTDTRRVGEIWLDGKSVSLAGSELTVAVPTDNDVHCCTEIRYHIFIGD